MVLSVISDLLGRYYAVWLLAYATFFALFYLPRIRSASPTRGLSAELTAIVSRIRAAVGSGAASSGPSRSGLIEVGRSASDRYLIESLGQLETRFAGGGDVSFSVERLPTFAAYAEDMTRARSMAGLFVLIGLLGTMARLNSVVEDIGLTSQQTGVTAAEFLTNMGTIMGTVAGAFNSSIIGLLLMIVALVGLAWYDRRVQDRITALESTILADIVPVLAGERADRRVHLELPDSGAHLDHLRAAVADLGEAHERLSAVVSGVREAGHPMADAAASLSGILESLSDHLRGEGEAQHRQARMLQRIAALHERGLERGLEHQDREASLRQELMAAMDEQGRRLAEATRALEASAEALREAGARRERDARPVEAGGDEAEAYSEGPAVAGGGPPLGSPDGRRTERGAFDPADGIQRDEVDCSLFAPPEAAPGQSVLLQVFAHTVERAAEASARARTFDADAEPRGAATLATKIPRGSTLTFRVDVPGVETPDPEKDLRWTGRTGSVQFALHIPAPFSPGSVLGRVYVEQDRVPIGEIGFKLQVVPKVDPRDRPAAPTGEARRYTSAFISYAARDRAEVLRRLSMLTAVGIRYFHDLLNLEPGERWRRQLYRKIDESDVFFLFWSTAARQSRWVRKEWRYAVKQKGTDFIRPVIIEGPPIPPPPRRLRHLHFNDKTLYVLRGTEAHGNG